MINQCLDVITQSQMDTEQNCKSTLKRILLIHIYIIRYTRASFTVKYVTLKRLFYAITDHPQKPVIYPYKALIRQTSAQIQKY